MPSASDHESAAAGVDLLKSANLLLRFLLELCVLAAVAYWGATTGFRLPARIGLAVGLPLLVAVIWGLLVSPGRPVDLGPALRLVIELVIFAGGVVALFARERVLLGVLLALLYIGNRILMAVWDQ
jgi:hypothetical protein